VLTLKLIRQKKDIRGRYCFHSQTNPPTASNENCATITTGVACIFIFLYLANYSEVKKKGYASEASPLSWFKSPIALG